MEAVNGEQKEQADKPSLKTQTRCNDIRLARFRLLLQLARPLSEKEQERLRLRHTTDHSNETMDKEKKSGKQSQGLNEKDITLLKSYGKDRYHDIVQRVKKEIETLDNDVKKFSGANESSTGVAPADQWNIIADEMVLHHDPPLLVVRCMGKFTSNTGETRYVVEMKPNSRLVVEQFDGLQFQNVDVGMRVAVDQNKYQIRLPLPPKIDSAVAMMEVEEKPDVKYSDIGGYEKEIFLLREIIEAPMLNPEKFVRLGIDPPKGALLYGPPGTGKTMCARALANATDACFIRIIGSELVHKYVGEGAQMIRQIFKLARSKNACVLFFDEIDAIGGTRFNDDSGEENEVQRTMLELISQLDGFDPRGSFKVLMATNRPDTLDPALLRPGRIDRKVNFGLPDFQGTVQILKVNTRKMRIESSIRFDLLARLMPNCTGAEIRSVCTEAGVYAIRDRRKMVNEKDFLNAIQKVIHCYARFNSTPRYLTHN
uniref:26S proteasome regulatory subunit 7 n=1 Tax=Trichuris muris TaxID=70415 RepID=A0A5S6QCQ9_TRIMR